MANSNHFLPLYDKTGNMYAVLLSAELWTRNRHKLEPLIKSMLEDLEPALMAGTHKPEPVAEWEEFKAYWDFKYPLSADVECGNCKVRTEDWLGDPAKPFRLKSAQLGGLVVFHCNTCGATVRKKHFKDHVCFEFTAGVCGK